MKHFSSAIAIATVSSALGAFVAMVATSEMPAPLNAQTGERCAAELAAFHAANEAYQAATTNRSSYKAAYDAAGDAYQRCLSGGAGAGGGRPSGGPGANWPAGNAGPRSRGDSSSKGNAGSLNSQCAALWNAIAVYLRMDDRTTQGENAYAQAMQEYTKKCEAGPNGTHVHRGNGDVIIPDFYGEGSNSSDSSESLPVGRGMTPGNGAPSDPCDDRPAGAAPWMSPMKPAGGSPMKPRPGPVQGTFGGMMPQGGRGGGMQLAPQGGKHPPNEGFMAPLDGNWEPGVIY